MRTLFSTDTAPPRCDLNAEDRLIDLDLVPSAIVYYAGTSDLKADIKSKLTDPTAVSLQTVKTRYVTIFYAVKQICYQYAND